MTGHAVTIVVDGPSLLRREALAELRARPSVHVRVPVVTFDAAIAERVGAPHPRDVLRGIVAATSVGLHVEALLPIGAGLGSVAGRMHGLSRAAPRLARYLLATNLSLPDEQIAAQVDEAREVARELGIDVTFDDGPRIDTELQAVLCGVKPAIRLSTEAGDEQAIAQRYAQYGLHAVIADGAFVGDEGSNSRRMRLIYVARTMAAAEALREIEAKIVGPSSTDGDAYRALGRALGYPPCCVDHFVSDVVLDDNGAMRSPHPAEAWLSARTLRAGRAAWQLNYLLFDVGEALISFTPCRAACPAALAYANRVAEQLERVSPGCLERLRARVAVDVVVDAHGARALVEVADDRIVSARPRRAAGFRLVDPRDVALAERIVPAPVREGEVLCDDEHAPVLVQFGEAR